MLCQTSTYSVFFLIIKISTVLGLRVIFILLIHSFLDFQVSSPLPVSACCHQIWAIICFGQELEKNQWHWSNMHTAHFGQYLPPDGKRWWHWWWHASCPSWAVSSPDCLGGPAVPKELVSRTGETRASFESRNTFLPDQCSLSHWLRRRRL